MPTLYPSLDVAAGGVIKPTDALWNAASGQAGGTAAAVGDKLRVDRNVILDLAGGVLGDSGPMRPRTAPTVAVTGGGATGGLLAAGTYRVAFAWVDSGGKESIESLFSGSFTVAAGNIPRVTLPVPPHPQITAARVYLTNTAGSLLTLSRYTTSDVAITFGVAATADLAVAAPGTAVAPEVGAVRLTHTSARVKATGAWTLRGDLADARSSGTGKTWVVDINDDACDGTFESASSLGKYENVYGMHFGLTGIRGGLRMTGTVRSNPGVVATRPRIKSAGEGSWRYSFFTNAAPSGDYSLTDADITGCSDAVVSKTAAVGGLATPPQIATIATSGGTAGTGTLAFTSNNEQYAIAYSYADAAGNESARSPWSALFRPSASGAIPRVTLPTAIPAGVTFIHLYLIDIRLHKAEDAQPRYRAFVAVTAGTTPTVDLNASASRSVSAILVGLWTGGEEMTAQRTRFRRCGSIGSLANPAASAIMHDDFNWYRECLDAPVKFFGTSAVTTKTMVGGFYDTLLSPIIDNVNGLSLGTAADPVFLSNFTPLMSGAANKLDDGSRAYCRMSKQWGNVYPGSMNRWRVCVDGSREWIPANRLSGSLAIGIANFHGWSQQVGILVQQFAGNIIDSFASDGVGDFFVTAPASPTGLTTWATTGNLMGADLANQNRRVGDVVQSNGADTTTQRERLYWTKNTGFIGTQNEPQLGHFNETSTFAGLVQDFSYNLAYAPDFPPNAVLLADFHSSGYTTLAVVAHADFNAGYGLKSGTQTMSANPTVYAVQRGYDLRDEAFVDASSVDMRGGLGPLRADPQMRAFFRNDVTFMWREKGYALGSARPSGALVTDGTAKNQALQASDMQELYDWLVTVWWARPYVNADGSFANVMDAIEFYRQWGTAPTNPLYAPAMNGGDTPGWTAYVPLLSASPVAVLYRVRRRLTD